MRYKFMLLTGSAMVCLFAALSLRPSPPASAQAGTVCLQTTAPLVTHGTTPIQPLLPSGDLFLLPSGLQFVAATAPTGSSAGTVTAANFGSLPSRAAGFGFAGTGVPFFANPTANSTLRAVSCVDDIWDINFVIASSGNTQGDRVRWSLQGPGGTFLLAEFTVEGNGVRVTARDADVTIFSGNILANTGTLDVGDFIGFSVGAGTAGLRTPEITIAFSASPSAKTRGCQRLLLDLINAGGDPGTISVAITSIVVKRMGNAASGPGLLTNVAGGGLTGTFPTGAVCAADCPAACPTPTPTVAPTASPTPTPSPCPMICFRRPLDYCLNGIPLSLTVFNNVTIRTLSGGRFSTSTLAPGAIPGNLNCSLRFIGEDYFLTPSQDLQGRYVATQISVGSTTNPPFNTANLRLGCFVMPMFGQNPLPVTLSNGVTINANTSLATFFTQTELALTSGTQADVNALRAIYLTLACGD
jgi:hypothetical protein